MRKTVQKLVYYGLPLVLGLAVWSVRDGEVFATMGLAAFWLLTVNLYIKPVAVVWPNKWLNQALTWRRELGVASFWLYVGHALGLNVTGRYTWALALNPDLFIFYGVMAGTGLWALALTSNDWAVRKLKRNWKRLHRLVYPVYFLVLYHVSVAQGKPEMMWGLGGVYIGLKVWQWIKAGRI